MEENKKLREDQLEAVSGGATQNRYDPNVCAMRTKPEQSCWGAFGVFWCDYYRRAKNHNESSHFEDVYDVECAMGCYKTTERNALDPSE